VLEVIDRCYRLKRLVLDCLPCLTDRVPLAIMKQLPQLEALYLNSCPGKEGGDEEDEGGGR